MVGTHAVSRPASAIWKLPHPWLSAIGFALIPVVFTAVGSAAGQLLETDEVVSSLLIAAGAVVSAVIGLVVMVRSRPSLRSYGFRPPRNARAVWWFAPPAATIVLVTATGGVSISWGAAAAALVLCAVVAVNEEVWFRGIILAVLRAVSVRVALIATSVLFGILHLANLASGTDSLGTLLQVLFAALFGIVTVELVVITGSLLPAIVWHFAWDFTSFLGGDTTSPLALTGVGASCAVMLVYAIALWPRAVAIAE